MCKANVALMNKDASMHDGVGLGTLPVREGRAGTTWFREHFDEAAGAILDFLRGDRVEFAGKRVADIGAGDGIIDLGLAMKGQPARLVGFDIVETDAAGLRAFAAREGVTETLPENLEFRLSEATRIPAEDASFDIVVSWSTFEHVADPVAVLQEIRRILQPYGVLMIQIWPFFHSQHGSHLWQYFPEGFVQLLRRSKEIEEAVRADPGPDPEWAEVLIEQFYSANQLTLDELQRALYLSGFAVRKLELLSETVHLPPGLERYPLSLLGISGVKLLASAMTPSASVAADAGGNPSPS
jgi:SAM-dependent methyltransferase